MHCIIGMIFRLAGILSSSLSLSPLQCYIKFQCSGKKTATLTTPNAMVGASVAMQVVDMTYQHPVGPGVVDSRCILT